MTAGNHEREQDIEHYLPLLKAMKANLFEKPKMVQMQHQPKPLSHLIQEMLCLILLLLKPLEQPKLKEEENLITHTKDHQLERYLQFHKGHH